MTYLEWFFNPFRAPEPLPTLNPSNLVPKNGFPVAKGLKYTGKMKAKQDTIDERSGEMSREGRVGAVLTGG